MAISRDQQRADTDRWYVPSSDYTAVIAPPGVPVIEVARTFDAPNHLVFDALTSPGVLRRWWGAHSMQLEQCDIDLNVGGAYRFVLRGADGRTYEFRGVYRDIRRPTRVVFTESFDGAPNAETHNTVVIEERDRESSLNMTVLHRTVSNRDAHMTSGLERGVRESHVRLDELLDRRTLALQYVVDAPRDAVFEAWTDLRRLAQWFAPQDSRIGFVDRDLQVGGRWRRVIHPPRGDDQRVEGRYLEIEEPRRLAMTFTVEPDVGHPRITTNVVLTFESIGSRTSVYLDHGFFETAVARDRQRDDWMSTLRRLDEYLGTYVR
jgi:uncharacterized protein YndB with AHSA1/START domain